MIIKAFFYFLFSFIFLHIVFLPIINFTFSFTFFDTTAPFQQIYMLKRKFSIDLQDSGSGLKCYTLNGTKYDLSGEEKYEKEFYWCDFPEDIEDVNLVTEDMVGNISEKTVNIKEKGIEIDRTPVTSDEKLNDGNSISTFAQPEDEHKDPSGEMFAKKEEDLQQDEEAEEEQSVTDDSQQTSGSKVFGTIALVIFGIVATIAIGATAFVVIRKKKK